MELDQESYKILINSDFFKYREDRVTFFEADINVYVENGKEILHVLNDIQNKEVFYFERDYSSPNSTEDLIKFLGRKK